LSTGLLAARLLTRLLSTRWLPLARLLALALLTAARLLALSLRLLHAISHRFHLRQSFFDIGFVAGAFARLSLLVETGLRLL
jgi:hypothetical protein